MTLSKTSLSRIAGGAAVLAIAGILYLPGLGNTRGAIWDESYYFTAIQRQVEHRAQFASHPPLGFLLLATGARLAGDDGSAAPRIGDDKRVDGRAIPADYDYARTRLSSAIAAIAAAGVFYILMLLVTGRLILALPLSNLFLFEPSFLAQFRAAQLDAFLMLFSLIGLVAIVWARRTPKRRIWGDGLFGLAVGLATAIKLSGVLLALAGALLVAERLWLGRLDRRTGSVDPTALGATRGPLVRAIGSAGVMATSFAAAIAGVYLLQLADGSRLPADTPAGTRDAAFLSTAYRDYLEGARPAFSVLPVAVADSLRYMASDFEGTPKADANGSEPLQWPLMRQTITYRWDSDGQTTRYVALVGNPVGWALGGLGLLVARFTAARAKDPARRRLAGGLLLLWSMMLGAHLWLGQSRVLYLYHYFLGLVLCWTMLAVWLKELAEGPPVWPGSGKAAVGAVALHLAAFAWLAPFAYGHALTEAGCSWRAPLVSHPICRKGA